MPGLAAADYRIESETERLALLHQLRDAAVPVHLHTSDGSTLRATLWSVQTTPARLVFGVDAAAPALARIVEHEEASAVAWPEQIKLQFDLTELLLVHGNEGSTLQCALPRELLRFQRRGAYRVALPRGAPPLAHLRHPALPEMQLALRLLDVSLGGCALWLPADVPPLAAGSTWAEVRLELDLHTELRAALTLQHLSAPAPQGKGQRCGCAWQLARPEDQRVLQRWIDQAQKRQRALARA
jgi:c-di-GMP-binding flagellar brake protein YcgR